MRDNMATTYDSGHRMQDHRVESAASHEASLTTTRHVAPSGAGLPGAPSAAVSRTATIPTMGIPVLVLHGPLAMRAALAIVHHNLLVRPLAPLVPSTRLRRDEIAAIEVEDGHWYEIGHTVICVRRVHGPSMRLMSPPVPGITDGTENLGRLLRAWWRSGQG